MHILEIPCTEEVGINDKRVFIKLNGLPSGYKYIQSFKKQLYSLCMVLLIFSTLEILKEVS